MNIHVLSGIQTHDSSNQVAACLCLRLPSYWDCHYSSYTLIYFESVAKESVCCFKLSWLANLCRNASFCFNNVWSNQL